MEGLVTDVVKQATDTLKSRLERTEDEIYSLIETECKLSRAQSRLLEAVRQDSFQCLESLEIKEKVEKGVLNKTIRVSSVIHDRCKGNEFYESKVAGFGSNGETLRVMHSIDMEKKSVKYILQTFSFSVPVETVLEFATTWRCPTHGFEEAIFKSDTEMICGACQDYESPFSLQVSLSGYFSSWIGENELEDESVLWLLTMMTLGLSAGDIPFIVATYFHCPESDESGLSDDESGLSEDESGLSDDEQSADKMEEEY